MWAEISTASCESENPSARPESRMRDYLECEETADKKLLLSTQCRAGVCYGERTVTWDSCPCRRSAQSFSVSHVRPGLFQVCQQKGGCVW